MRRLTNLGCGQTLLISFGVLLLFVLAMAAWHRGTVAMMFDNMLSMSEGADAAETLRAPEDVIEYLARHPGETSLVVFDTERPEAGLYFQAEAARPVVGISRLLILAEFARQAAEGTLDGAARVDPEALAAYDLRARSAAAQDTLPACLTLSDVVHRMMQKGDQAAADLLLRRLGRENLAALPNRLGLGAGARAPLPQSGTHLSWYPATLTEATLAGASAATYADSVYALTERLEADSVFREEAVALRRGGQASLSLSRQRALAAATYPQGTAAAYAALLNGLLADSLFSDEAVRLMRSAVERPLPGDAEGAIGSKAGSFPGLISFAGYVRHTDRPGGRVVVLLMEDLPTAVFYHFLQTGLDNVFELRLLLDDAFLERARERLGGPVPERFAAPSP